MEVQGSLALVGRALEAAEHALQVSLYPQRRGWGSGHRSQNQNQSLRVARAPGPGPGAGELN